MRNSFAASHSLDGSAGMPRRFYLGNHSYAESVGIAHYIHKLIGVYEAVGSSLHGIGIAVTRKNLRQETFVARGRITTARTHVGEFEQAADLQAPCLVVGYVEVKTFRP